MTSLIQHRKKHRKKCAEPIFRALWTAHNNLFFSASLYYCIRCVVFSHLFLLVEGKYLHILHFEPLFGFQHWIPRLATSPYNYMHRRLCIQIIRLITACMPLFQPENMQDMIFNSKLHTVCDQTMPKSSLMTHEIIHINGMTYWQKFTGFWVFLNSKGFEV